MRKTRFRVTMCVVQSHIWEVAELGLEPFDCCNPDPQCFTLAPSLVSGLVVSWPSLMDSSQSPYCGHRAFVCALSMMPSLSSFPLFGNFLFIFLKYLNITSPSGKIVTLSALGFHHTPFIPQTWSPPGCIIVSVCKSGLPLDLVHSRWSVRPVLTYSLKKVLSQCLLNENVKISF